MTTPRIRRATVADAYALWLWANDVDTRAASNGRPPIPWPEHVSWLSHQLSSPAAAVLMAECDSGQPVGSTRFDTLDDWATARLSYVVAPEARGRGLSRAMIVAAIAWERQYTRQYTPRGVVFAEVRSDNGRSLRVFRALGWSERVDESSNLHRFEYRT